jgi:hypothetical protein
MCRLKTARGDAGTGASDSGGRTTNGTPGRPDYQAGFPEGGTGRLADGGKDAALESMFRAVPARLSSPEARICSSDQAFLQVAAIGAHHPPPVPSIRPLPNGEPERAAVCRCGKHRPGPGRLHGTGGIALRTRPGRFRFADASVSGGFNVQRRTLNDQQHSHLLPMF